MNDLLIYSFERLRDQRGRPVAWRGRWAVAYHSDDRPVEMPVEYPRRYFKVGRDGTAK